MLGELSREVLIEELTYFYFNYDNFQTNRLSEFDIKKYFDTAIRKKLIIYVSDGFKLKGYCEFWRINYEQFGRILCGNVNIVKMMQEEDIETGCIAHIANATIHPEHRLTGVYKFLKVEFFRQNFTADYFTGERQKIGITKVFKRDQISHHLKHLETVDGNR